MQIYLSELLPKEEMIRVVSDTGCGIELIQFGISDQLDRFEETMKQVRCMLSDCGNPPVSIHGPFLDLNPMSYDTMIRAATMWRFEQAYEAARQLGAGVIVFHSGMIPTVYYTEGWADRMAEFWDEFLDGKSGITVCMENVLDRETEPFVRVFELVDHPDFGACLDTGHAHCYADDTVLKWAERLAGRIRHVHIHDNDGSRDAHLGIGDGTIPWREVISYLQKTSQNLSFTIECAGKEALLKSVSKLKSHL